MTDDPRLQGLGSEQLSPAAVLGLGAPGTWPQDVGGLVEVVGDGAGRSGLDTCEVRAGGTDGRGRATIEARLHRADGTLVVVAVSVARTTAHGRAVWQVAAVATHPASGLTSSVRSAMLMHPDELAGVGAWVADRVEALQRILAR